MKKANLWEVLAGKMEKRKLIKAYRWVFPEDGVMCTLF